MTLEQIKAKKKAIESLSILGYLMIGVSFILFIPISIASEGIGTPLVMVSFLFGGIIAAIAAKQFKQLSNDFKVLYLTPELKRLIPDATLEVNKGFSQEEIYDSKVLKKCDRFKSEDLIQGTLDGVYFKEADVHLQDVRSTGKSTTVVTIFLGRVFCFQFEKSFQNDLIILQPQLGASFRFPGYEHIKTESVAFNKNLSVYSKDALNAFRVLTPHFMERLLTLDEYYHDRISLSFTNNLLYVAINTKVDSYELKMFGSIDDTIIHELKRNIEDTRFLIASLSIGKNTNQHVTE